MGIRCLWSKPQEKNESIKWYIYCSSPSLIITMRTSLNIPRIYFPQPCINPPLPIRKNWQWLGCRLRSFLIVYCSLLALWYCAWDACGIIRPNPNVLLFDLGRFRLILHIYALIYKVLTFLSPHLHFCPRRNKFRRIFPSEFRIPHSVRIPSPFFRPYFSRWDNSRTTWVIKLIFCMVTNHDYVLRFRVREPI